MAAEVARVEPRVDEDQVGWHLGVQVVLFGFLSNVVLVCLPFLLKWKGAEEEMMDGYMCGGFLAAGILAMWVHPAPKVVGPGGLIVRFVMGCGYLWILWMAIPLLVFTARVLREDTRFYG